MSSRAIRPEVRDAISSESPASRRRKMSVQPKFYAVRIGHTPGVYLNWKDCEENITKYKNALFRTFPTRIEAEAFVAGDATVTLTSPEVKYYGVAVGREPGVYTDWVSAQEQIVGWKGPKYRKFATRVEAESFVRYGGVPNSKPASTTKKPGPRAKKISYEVEESQATGYELSEDETGSLPAAKRPKRTIGKDKILYPRTPQSAVAVPNDSPQQSSSVDGTKILTVYTDGSSLGNGKARAKAGVGVYFGRNDPRNIAERLKGDTQTNQRAELTAVLRALQVAPTHQETHIYTDSRYCINCVTVWYKNWERNEWQTSLKKPMMNRDLVEEILERIRERESLGTETKFVWIKGHSNDPNNDAADRLAVQGAQMA